MVNTYSCLRNQFEITLAFRLVYIQECMLILTHLNATEKEDSFALSIFFFIRHGDTLCGLLLLESICFILLHFV